MLRPAHGGAVRAPRRFGPRRPTHPPMGAHLPLAPALRHGLGPRSLPGRPGCLHPCRLRTAAPTRTATRPALRNGWCGHGDPAGGGVISTAWSPTASSFRSRPVLLGSFHCRRPRTARWRSSSTPFAGVWSGLARRRGIELEQAEMAIHPSDVRAEDAPLLAGICGASVAGRIATGGRAGRRVQRLRNEPADDSRRERGRLAVVIRRYPSSSGRRLRARLAQRVRLEPAVERPPVHVQLLREPVSARCSVEEQEPKGAIQVRHAFMTGSPPPMSTSRPRSKPSSPTYSSRSGRRPTATARPLRAIHPRHADPPLPRAPGHSASR